MTPFQVKLATALARVSFGSAPATICFARYMATWAEKTPERALEGKQAAFLYRIAWRYRRQLRKDLVDEAAAGLAAAEQLALEEDATRRERRRAARQAARGHVARGAQLPLPI